MTGTQHRTVATDLYRDTDWANQGRCRTADNPDLWFPAGYEKQYRAQVREAVAQCLRCPVIDACRAWALTIGQPDGIWGGTTPSQRRPRSVKGKAA